MRLEGATLLGPHRVGVLTVAAATLAFFWPLLFGYTYSTVAGYQESVYPWHARATGYADYPQSDQAALSYPWQAFLAHSLRSGDVPFWNPLSFAGQPFFSNGSSGVLYPPRLLAALLVSPGVAHDALSVFHVFGAGLAMFLLCRQLRLGTAGSLLGATSWMFASFNMAWLHLEVVAPVTVLAPLCLLLVRRAVESGGRRDVPAAALVLGTALVSGHLLMMGALWATAIGYGVWCALGTGLTAPRGDRGGVSLRAAGRLLAVTGGGPALFALALLPTAETIADSHREPLNYEWVHEDVRSEPRVLLNFLVPPALPISERSMNREMAFVGSLAGILALVGALRRGPAPALGRVLVGGVLLLAFDTPILKLAYSLVPGFTLVRPLGRLFFLLNLAVALLAAAGLETIAAGMRRAHRGPTGEPRARSWWSGTAAERMLVASIIVVNTAQLVRYGQAINPPFHPRTPSLLFPATPLIAAIQRHIVESGGRVLPVRRVRPHGLPSPPMLLGSSHMIFDLPSLGGYDSVVPSRALDLCLVVAGAPVEQVLQNPGVGAYLSDFLVGPVRFDLLPRLGVTAVVAPPGIHKRRYWPRETAALPLVLVYAGEDGELHRIAGAPGDVWLASQAAVVDSDGDALRKVTETEFDPLREVVLLRSEAAAEAQVTLSGPETNGRARLIRRTNNRLLVEVASSRGGWLVMAHTWDRGWRASVDGRPARLLRANYAFRAVRVPPGRHRVEMHYRPAGLLRGLLCTGMATFLAALAACSDRLHRARGGTE